MGRPYRSSPEAGPDVARISSARLSRLVQVIDLREKGLKGAAIQERTGQSHSAYSGDLEKISYFGERVIRAELSRRAAASGRAQQKRRACPYMTVEDGQVVACGTLSDQQYCAAHRDRAVLPRGGNSQTGVSSLIGGGGRV